MQRALSSQRTLSTCHYYDHVSREAAGSKRSWLPQPGPRQGVATSWCRRHLTTAPRLRTTTWCRDSVRGNHDDRRDDDELEATRAGSRTEERTPTGTLPSALDGLNWWCYTVLGLIFITDFSPLGPLLLYGNRNAGLYLAAVQWGVFVLPTLNYCRERSWDLRQVLRLRGCSPKWIVAGAAGGAVLWAVTAAAVAARTGVDLSQLSGVAAADGPGNSPVTTVLFSELLQRPNDPTQWALVLTTSAVSPAVAEELLYRGFLLTAMRQRFGTVDAVALTAALFAAAHLSIPQFFAFTVLGAACGALALASGSVLPAVVAHVAYNATGLAVGVAVVLATAGRGAGTAV